MSFIVPGAESPYEQDIAQDFWPDIEPAELRGAMRLDGTVTTERLMHSLAGALISVNTELADWGRGKQADLYTSLDDVPNAYGVVEKIDGVNRYVLLYKRAVFCQVAAECDNRLRGFDATQTGTAKADEINPEIANLLRDKRWAISDILGRARNTIELI